MLMYACVRCFGLYSLSYGIVDGHLALSSCLTLCAKYNVNMFGCIEGLRAKALCSIIQCCPA